MTATAVVRLLRTKTKENIAWCGRKFSRSIMFAFKWLPAQTWKFLVINFEYIVFQSLLWKVIWSELETQSLFMNVNFSPKKCSNESLRTIANELAVEMPGKQNLQTCQPSFKKENKVTFWYVVKFVNVFGGGRECPCIGDSHAVILYLWTSDSEQWTLIAVLLFMFEYCRRHTSFVVKSNVHVICYLDVQFRSTNVICSNNAHFLSIAGRQDSSY